MKNLLRYIFILFFLSACTSTNRLHRTFHADKQQNNLILKQTLNVSQDNKFGEVLKSTTNLNHVRSVYILNEMKDIRPVVTVGFHSKSSNKSFVTDSIIFILLNHEKIRINSVVNSKSGLNSKQFIIPENLWISIRHAKCIGYLFYQETNEIMFNLDLADELKLKEFFKSAIRLRDKNFPELPEGMKKW